MTGVSIDALPLTPLVVSGEALVWSGRLDQPESTLEELTATLTPDEVVRATRFAHAAPRRRFIAARGMLRVLLSRHVNLEPAQIRFTYSPQGKPELSGSAAREDIRFNVSHSHERVVYVVGRGCRVGVDIEHVRPVANVSAVAMRFFSPGENAALQMLPANSRLAAFFRCWTRKEALVKGLGEGISDYLRRFDVSVAPDEPAKFLNVEGWTLEDLSVGAGVTAAVVVEAHA